MHYPRNPVPTVTAGLTLALLASCGSEQDPPPSQSDSPEMRDTRDAEPATPAGSIDAATESNAAAVDTGRSTAEGGSAMVDTDNDPCTLEISAGDNIAYSTNALSVPSTCPEVSVTLTHTGKLPAAAMGHNWVLLREGELESVAMAGVSAGLAGDYLPANDDRIIAATGIVGGGESDTVNFSLDELEDGQNYVYVCTFPGHWSVMKGRFSITSSGE